MHVHSRANFAKSWARYFSAVLLAGIYACSSADGPVGEGDAFDDRMAAAEARNGGGDDLDRCDAGGGPDAGVCSSGVPAPAPDGGGNCYLTGCPSQHVCQPTSPGVGSCLFVPDPPPSCMAPCVWEARKDCLPILGDCTTEGTVFSCNTQTGWYTNSGFGMQRSITTGRCGQVCFGAFATQSGILSYFDETETIALVSGNSVCCGCELNVPPTPDQIFVELDTPECLEWKETYLSLTTCSSSSEGSCSGIAYQ